MFMTGVLCTVCGDRVYLSYNVALTLFQSYCDLTAGDIPSLKLAQTQVGTTTLLPLPLRDEVAS